MKNLTRTIYLIAILVVMASCSNNKIKCVLKGEVVNIEYDTLALLKATEDLEWGEKVFIPVIDGKFEYIITTDIQEVYVLFFEKQLESGAITTYKFVPVNGTVNFKLYPGPEYDKVEIIGGEINDEIILLRNLYHEKFGPSYELIYEKQNILSQQNLYLTKEFSELQNKIHKAFDDDDGDEALYLTNKIQKFVKSGKHLTPQGMAVQHQLDSLQVLSSEWFLDYYSESLSVFSFYELWYEIKSMDFQNSIDLKKIETIAFKYHEKYPEHPYTSLTQAMLEARELIQIGNKYIDFTLPDLEDNMHKLSDVIDGKFAVIDLWASWCGPCIMGSRELLPIYEEFKNMGFTVCGVAREYRNTEAMALRIKHEKYPWINLVELDDQNDIWLTYGVSGGGRKFLVDVGGFILAIEPNATEIREILNARLALN